MSSKQHWTDVSVRLPPKAKWKPVMGCLCLRHLGEYVSKVHTVLQDLCSLTATAWFALAPREWLWTECSSVLAHSVKRSDCQGRRLIISYSFTEDAGHHQKLILPNGDNHEIVHRFRLLLC
jgi:hypothetical protein